MDHVAEIKNRLPIEELVGQYVQLKKMGRNFKGLCPFHNERTPSFYVSTEKQLAYCFGCRKGGDHFKFIQEIEHIEFPDALKLLAEKANVELPHITPKQREYIIQEKTLKERLFDLHQIAAKFYEESLWGEVGKHALDYIKNRGFSDETIRTFHIGYAPARGESDELYRTILMAGFTKDECEKSGLILTRSTDSDHHFDRFRNRLMVPILNQQGRICAFGGRALQKEDEPKYLNSPETPIYHKSSILFGLSNARNDIRTQGYCVCVEGYMDMIAVFQSGVKNVVATSGTALTKEHLDILKKQTDRLVFSFDADFAGRQATLRAIELALPLGFSIGVAVWPGDSKDPDEMCNLSPDKYKEACSKSTPVSAFLIDYFKKLNGVATIEQRVSCAQNLIPFVLLIQSPIFVDEWLKQASQSFGVSIDALYKELKKHGTLGRDNHRGLSLPVSKPETAPISDKTKQKEEYFLGLLLTYPALVGVVNQLISTEIFLDLQLQNVYRSMLDQYNSSGGDFCFDDSLKEHVMAAQLFAEHMLVESQREMSQAEASIEVVSVSRSLARTYVTRQKSLLRNELINVGTKEHKQQLLEQFEQLNNYELRLSSHL